MLRLEAAGYPIVLHVHDEIVAEASIGFGSSKEFQQIIVARPEWAEGLPIARKVDERERFCKIKPPPEAGPADAPGIADTVDDIAECSFIHGEPDDDLSEPNDKLDERDNNTMWHKNDDDRDDYSSGERPWGGARAEYIYRDVNGAPYLRVVRTTAKQFPQYHWENGRWLLGKPAPGQKYHIDCRN